MKVTNGETIVYLAKTTEVRYTSLGYRQENDVTMREAFNSTADNGIVTRWRMILTRGPMSPEKRSRWISTTIG